MIFVNRKEYVEKYNKQYYKNNREKLRKKHKQYHADNRERDNERTAKQHEKGRKFINDYKLSKGCAICGYNKCASALDFHHNGDKKFTIGEKSGCNLETLKEEIEKCIVLCRNCHAELHEGDKK